MRRRLGLKRNDRGATAIEYGLIAGLIGLGLVGALASTRSSLKKDFGCITTGVAGDDAAGLGADRYQAHAMSAIGFVSGRFRSHFFANLGIA